MKFSNFNSAINKQIATMVKGDLFRSAVPADLLWQTYLASFPEGTNPIYRTRTEHDCSRCRQFVRAIGNMVSIVDGKIVTIWDTTIKNEPEFQVVSDAMAKLVKSYPIADSFLHYEAKVGSEKSFEQLAQGGIHQWDHFYATLPAKFVVKNADIASKLGEIRSGKDVLLRSLNELTMDSVDTVLELIAQNSLYRGQEHKFAVTEFRKLKTAFQKFKGDPDVFVWSIIGSTAGSVARFRNTSIGTLVTDMSSGIDMSDAVRMFESKVAGPNYKRPTALVTKAMVEKAKKTIDELGLTSALERRYATLADITVNNILFANRSTRKAMGDVFDELATKAVSKKAFDKVEEVSIEKFLADILPKADSIEMLVENTHTSNLVSLIAPVDATAGRLFKWDNAFSWSYTGDMADSIKERVKSAGGNVTGEFCCRLAWYNHDDLDFHMVEPDGREIYFGRKQSSTTCGKLDVDMNAGCGKTRTPVENIFYDKLSGMKEGEYTLFVNQWAQRESIDVGFDVEIDILGETYSFNYPNRVSGGDVVVAKFTYSKKTGLTIKSELKSSTRSKEVWGIHTNQFVKVNAMMMSPNHWGGVGIGNKHYFFMLDGCANDGTARGFYNEFLREDLNEHRKVLEMVGSKMKTEESADQLSGIGFSSTQRNSVVLKVSGAFTRTVKVLF